MIGIRWETARGGLPDPLPPGLQIVADDPETGRVTLEADLPGWVAARILDAYRAFAEEEECPGVLLVCPQGRARALRPHEISLLALVLAWLQEGCLPVPLREAP